MDGCQNRSTGQLVSIAAVLLFVAMLGAAGCAANTGAPTGASQAATPTAAAPVASPTDMAAAPTATTAARSEATTAPTATPSPTAEPLRVEFNTSDFSDTKLIYAPSTQPDLFVDCIDNPYYPLIPGTIYHLEEQTDAGLETVTITVTNQTKQVMGIPATVVRDTVRLEGQLKEDTSDWYAQDDRGNVWYMGEDTQEYQNGEVASTSGSWQAGVDGAKPGFLMLGQPRPGDLYYQEYSGGEAEDMGAVVSLNESATVQYGAFDNALQTAAYNPLDDELEHKWYAPGVGVVKETVVGGSASAELISVSHDASQLAVSSSCGRRGGVPFVGTIPVRDASANLEDLAQISADEAIQAVLDVRSGASATEDAQLGVAYGFLIYKVTLDSGAIAAVDAGDGVVLAVIE